MKLPFRIDFRGSYGSFEYKTLLSCAADISLQPGGVGDVWWDEETKVWTIPNGTSVALPTGLFIVDVDRQGISEWTHLGFDVVPRFRILPRSSFSKARIGCEIGTIEADYEGFQMFVILDNKSGKEFSLSPGDRIGQLEMGLAFRIPGVPVRNEMRTGGFGSTGLKG